MIPAHANPMELEMSNEKQRAQLVEKVKEHGNKAGNITLLRDLGWKPKDYWSVRDDLVNEGILEVGRGKGGSVRLIGPSLTDSQAATFTSAALALGGNAARQEPIGRWSAGEGEEALYPIIIKVIRESWLKDKRYGEDGKAIIETTARAGRKDTGGRWTRPDITVVSLSTLLYMPGKQLDVTTFEVKASNAIDVTAVYEALAHRRAATRSYVWMHVPDSLQDELKEVLEAIAAEAKRYGVGVIVASVPSEYETWDEIVEAERVDADYHKLNDFVAVQFGQTSRDELLKLIK